MIAELIPAGRQPGPRCGRRLYDGTSACCRLPGHVGAHEKWEDHGDRSALAFRWHDCPRCGGSCSDFTYRAGRACGTCVS